MEYFLTLLGFLITGIFMIWRYKLKLFNSKKHGWIVLGVVFLLIILWDSVAVYRGYWSFHSPHILKYRLGLLPLEEYFLAFIVPWWIVVFYKTIEKKLK